MAVGEVAGEGSMSIGLSQEEFANVCRDYEAEIERLRSELSSAIGYMMNARIDLETGCTKKTAICTISGGITRARAALDAQ